MSATSRRNKKLGRKTTARQSGGAAKCPRCKRQAIPQGAEGVMYCRTCGGFVDLNPEEGGDYSDHNVAARLEREERRREKYRR